jgi:hypothetical protein
MRRPILLVATLAAAALVAFGVALALRGGGGNKQPPKRLVATAETAVSRLPGPQSETAIVADPRHGNVLLAGSNDIRGRAMAVYGSTDGGRHWTHGHLPGLGPRGFCLMSDPSVAIDLRGRQYYSFLGLRCTGHLLRSSFVYVAARPGPAGRWRIVAAVARQGFLTQGDDHPMLLADAKPASPHRGRLWLGWTRFAVNRDVFVNPEDPDVDFEDARALVSYSDDGGRHWSKPALLARGGRPLEVRLATGPSGALYAAWRDSTTNVVYISRSDDGVAFRPGTFVAASVVPDRRSCFHARARIPAQPRRCVSPNPFVSVDPSGDRVYVTYGSTSLFASQNVYLAVFDASLKPLLGVGKPSQVNPPGDFSGPDAFLPTSAVDPKSGRLWVCYYESGRGQKRKTARYTCTVSSDGGESWLTPRHVAHVASNETVKPANRGNGYGDYEGVTALGGVAHAIWTDSRDLRELREEVYTARLVER